ncbi:MAG: response regulator [Desulfosporosinus sp.]|nr:response regulator [Desulfosporosinus sp.]
MEKSNSNIPQSTKVVDAILIVDDEPMFLSLAKKMIARLGFAALKAKDGKEAIEVFEQHKNVIRCVLCDVYMPRMGGWETLSRLRQLEPHIPVILKWYRLYPS